jgi:hypothetical protein
MTGIEMEVLLFVWVLRELASYRKQDTVLMLAVMQKKEKGNYTIGVPRELAIILKTDNSTIVVPRELAVIHKKARQQYNWSPKRASGHIKNRQQYNCGPKTAGNIIT